MKTIKTKTAACLLAAGACLLLKQDVKANNLLITNVVYVPGTPAVTFSISWDNSWYTTGSPALYDGVWVFVKYQACGSTVSPWLHAGLSTTSANHTIACQSSCPGVTMTVDAVTDGKGVFIHRTTSGLGLTQVWNVSLRINPAIAACPAAASCNWKVFGIEMAYSPQMAYTVGDGSGTTNNPFTNQSIPNENAITAAVLGGTSTANLPAAYPKGYKAFYCMKTEISQEQYMSFLNTLTYDQQMSRVTQSPGYFASAFPWALTLPTPAATPYNRNGIKMSVIGFNNFTPATYIQDLDGNNAGSGANDGIHLACNYLSWGDVSAFLDWAALRPMTELEYEKVCRGPDPSVADEYPWGTTNVTSLTSALISNVGQVSEVATTFPANGLCVYNGAGTLGPVRGGASAGVTNREQAAAGYFGPLDMAGNVWEQVVNVNTDGALFTGLNGDGALTTAGNANQANWPSPTTAAGSGARGGSWFTTAANAQQLRTSDRTNALNGTATRDMGYGGRGVR